MATRGSTGKGGRYSSSGPRRETQHNNNPAVDQHASARPTGAGDHNTRTGQRTGGTSGMRRSPRPDVQCRACATYGHDLNDCKWLPRMMACMEYVEKNPTTTKDTLRQYRRSQHPDTRQATRERMIRVLHAELGEYAGEQCRNHSR
jgi:hypothetical protein